MIIFKKAAISMLLLSSVCLWQQPAQAAIPASERAALIALYDATDGENWIDKTGWLGAVGTECGWEAGTGQGWYGVYCSSDANGSHVVAIEIIGNQLGGSIPAELGQLSQLQYLNLSLNQLGGSIPAELGQLNQLIGLYLYDNQINGSIPAELGQLSQLQYLNLSINQFSGSIPAELGQLNQLSLFEVSNNIITNIATQIAQLTCSFSISNNCLSESTLDPAVATFLDQKDPGWQATQKTSCTVVDNPPTVTINTSGSSDNNPKTADFDLDVTVTDDIGLQAVAYTVKTSSSDLTGQNGVVNLNGTMDTATFLIDLDSLAVGSYKIEVGASDTKPQESARKEYLFQKVDPTNDNPPIVTINTSGSGDNNPKTADFDLDVTVTDDIGLQAVSYTVKTSSGDSTGQNGVVNLTGTTDTAIFLIDLDSLAVGSYKIEVGASDTKPQESARKEYLFQKVETTDNPPIVTINTSGSGYYNPKTADFSINVTVTDDIGLQSVAYAIKTSSGDSTGQNGVVNLTGTTDTATFLIDLDSLAVGSYKIEVGASDTKPQESARQEYLFQKVESGQVPTITDFTVGEGTIPETGLRFTVTLSEPLPDGYGVFVNFDDQQGHWFGVGQDGWHLELQDQGDSMTYMVDYSLVKPGLRSFRAGIFQLNDPGDSDDTLVGDYTDSQTCTEVSCLEAVAIPNSYGDPAITGSGSELFKQVDVSNGNYHLATTDMSVDGKGPAFAFSRAYNSLALRPWTFGYEAKIAFVPDSFDRQVTIGPREDGRVQFFYKDMDDLWYTLNPGNFDQLMEDPDGSGDFVLYTQGNRLYRFAPPTTTEPGDLKSIEDRMGNALTFHYTGSDLTGATDANGRDYSITRDGNHRVQRVTDFAGRYVEYTYDANGMITDVRNMRDYHDRYAYVGTTGEDRYRLASITDPRGNVQMRIDYAPVTFTINGEDDTQDRVVTLTDGADAMTTFSYPFVEQSSSPFYLKQATGIEQPEVNGVNSNVVFMLDDQRTRVEARLDTVNAAEYVRTQGYQGYDGLDRQHVAEAALVVQVTDPNNNTTAIRYDDLARNRPDKVTDAAHGDYLASYEAIPGAPNLTALNSTQQPGVPATQFDDFSPTGQAGSITDPLGNTTTRTFDANAWISEETKPLGNSTGYSYDEFGNLWLINWAINNPNPLVGGQTRRIHDNLGRLIEETSPSSLVTRYTYDEHSNILTKNEQGGGIDYTTQYGYDNSDNLIWTIDPLNHRTDYIYDVLNRKIEEKYRVDGVDHIRRYTYDAMGRLATVTDERGNATTTHYDARSQVIEKINPLNETTTYTYDANGNVATVTDGDGHTLTYSYDELNRKIKQRDDEGHEQQWTYYPNGQVASHEDARGNITRYTYDASGNLKETLQDGKVTKADYDGNGNLVTVTDPAGHITRYTYDALDRRTSTTLHHGQQWIYEYDSAGNLISETTPNGEKTQQIFDELGRVTQRTEYDANQSLTRSIGYTYDANSNVTSIATGGGTIEYTYDAINRITSVTDQKGQTLSYAYDLAGNRTRLTYPGNKIVSYVYDEADRLDSLTDWLNQTTSYTRNQAGQVTDITNGNGTKAHFDYDDAGRLVRLQNLHANNSVISSHDLTLDEAGNITQATVDLPLMPTLPAGIDAMTYDNTNRLQTAAGKTYTHDDSGRIIEEDANGVQTIYQFDIKDHISQITRDGTILSQYAYDLNDNRISQTQNGVETRYVIDPLASLPNVIAETTAQGAISRYYVYGEGLVSQIDASGNSHYYHFDPTGHTLALTDASGTVTDEYAYSPYGHTTSQGSTPNPFRFVGKYGVMDDGNGLHYMRARYYKEDIMRFVSLDALHGDMLTPQALNRYAYVLGDPVMGVDPSGKKEGYDNYSGYVMSENGLEGPEINQSPTGKIWRPELLNDSSPTRWNFKTEDVLGSSGISILNMEATYGIIGDYVYVKESASLFLTYEDSWAELKLPSAGIEGCGKLKTPSTLLLDTTIEICGGLSTPGLGFLLKSSGPALVGVGLSGGVGPVSAKFQVGINFDVLMQTKAVESYIKFGDWLRSIPNPVALRRMFGFH
ncbi:RHS repeat-associated core domain-containing protein [Rhabdochromatium marinum]|uniref:RHS repeat-associated core domain-containing protein n=1 Tax=Rhabdochromatium marinum TaxID=48729 RepID=UPI0019039E14|nr:RHS repeat-associated core domain-containing protein [Rhabdochromatium marinum]MBK1647726.1 hypothetical protein [Rhabdochromatium marinum]